MKLHVLVQKLVFRQQVGKLPQLRVLRQRAVNEQVGRLDETGFLRQFLDRDPAITQNTLVAVN